MASSNEEEFLCPIHFDILEEPVVLAGCQHWFCKECLRKYVNSKNGIDPDCPECREPIELPLEGVDGLPVNYKMREICRSLQKRKQTQSQELPCTKHPEELIERFCCQCLVAVCEVCGDEDHHLHKVRAIGSAWKVVGQIIEDKFRNAKTSLATREQDCNESLRRRQSLNDEAQKSSFELHELLNTLQEQLNADSTTLQTSIRKQLDQDLQREDEYLRDTSEAVETVKRMEKYECHLRTLLTSKGHSITAADLDALNSLHASYNPGERKKLPPQHISRKFHPNKHINELIAGGIGAMLTEREIHELETREALQDSPDVFPTVVSSRSARGSSSGTRRLSDTLLLSSGDGKRPTPTDKMIHIKSKIVLPPEIAHPFDIEPYQTEHQFIVSDMTGAINLVTDPANGLGMPRVINLKPSTSEFILGISGITTPDKRFLYSCNQNETFLEKYDIQRVQCLQQIGDSNYLTSPRCITHSLTNHILYVSDTKGGVKAFDSNSGRYLTEIGNKFLLTPTGIATDTRSRLYVADELQSRIYVFDIRNMAAPKPLYAIKTSFNGMPVYCHGLHVDRNYHIWVSVTEQRSSYNSINLVMEFNEGGQFMRAGGWELYQPRGLRVHGKVATVVDVDKNCIVTYHV